MLMSEAKRMSNSRVTRTARRPALRIIETERPILGPSSVPVATRAPLWVGKYRRRLVSTDLGIIVGSMLLAFLTRFWWGETPAELAAIAVDYLLITGVIVVTWLITLAAYRTRDARIIGIGVTEYRRVVNASFIAFGLLAIAFVILKLDVARGYFILALPIGIVGLLASRWLWRLWLARRRRRRDR